MPWWRLHYHLVWSTRNREPSIDSTRERVIHHTLRRKARDLRLTLHAIGGIEDHVHVVVSIPPAISVAQCAKHLKGASARAVNQELPSGNRFGWQDEYGGVTLGERSLPSAIAYVLNQREHHNRNTLIPLFETTSDKHTE